MAGGPGVGPAGGSGDGPAGPLGGRLSGLGVGWLVAGGGEPGGWGVHGVPSEADADWACGSASGPAGSSSGRLAGPGGVEGPGVGGAGWVIGASRVHRVAGGEGVGPAGGSGDGLVGPLGGRLSGCGVGWSLEGGVHGVPGGGVGAAGGAAG
ncbi:hypothetical protein ACTIVE_4099, partial [Actinomadura verrucosospora]